MKALKVITAIILIISVFAIPALAAEVTPSIERKDSPELVSYTLDEVDTPCRTLLLIPYYHIQYDDIVDEDELDIVYDISEEMEEEIRISQRNALEELKNNELTDIVTGFEEAWTEVTGGAPVENAVVYNVFEIVLICSEEDAFKKDEPITVSFTVEGIDADDTFLVIHKPTGEDKWIIEEHEIDENGVITIHPDKLSPFAIITDNGEAPDATTDSPQTGVQEYIAVAGLAAVGLACVGVVLVKKYRRVSAQ